MTLEKLNEKIIFGEHVQIGKDENGVFESKMILKGFCPILSVTRAFASHDEQDVWLNGMNLPLKLNLKTKIRVGKLECTVSEIAGQKYRR